MGKNSFKFFTRNNFRFIFHQNPAAIPFCLPFIAPSLFSAFTSFIHWQRTRSCLLLSAAPRWGNNKNPEVYNWSYSAELVSLCLGSLFSVSLLISKHIFSLCKYFFHAIRCCAYQWKDEQSCTQEEMRVCLSHEEVSRRASLQWGDMTHAAGLYCKPPIKHSVRSSWFTARITLPLFSALLFTWL